jgi:hypothetical protein
MINDVGNRSIQKEVPDMVTTYRSKSHIDCPGTELWPLRSDANVECLQLYTRSYRPYDQL